MKEAHHLPQPGNIKKSVNRGHRSLSVEIGEYMYRPTDQMSFISYLLLGESTGSEDWGAMRQELGPIKGVLRVGLNTFVGEISVPRPPIRILAGILGQR